MTVDNPPDLETAFRQGMQAREERRRLADNPYDVQTPEHREWAAGWSAILDLDEDDDPESTRVRLGTIDTGADPDDGAGLGWPSGSGHFR